jgi:hypothetical protein
MPFDAVLGPQVEHHFQNAAKLCGTTKMPMVYISGSNGFANNSFGSLLAS